VKPEDITVEVRRSSKQDSKIGAFADVTIPFGTDGVVTIFGFSILNSDSRPPRVMAPARKGAKAWFDVVELTGKVRQLVEGAVLARYEQIAKAADQETK
jgi:hypothetical protein